MKQIMKNKANFLILKTLGRDITEIPLNQILYLEGMENYTLIHLTNGTKKVSSRTMLYHLKSIEIDTFLRIHRAYSVNINHVQSLDTKRKEYVQMANGKVLQIARRRKNII